MIKIQRLLIYRKMIMSRVLLCLLCFIALVYGQPSPSPSTSPDLATMIALRGSLTSAKLNWSDPNPCVWTGLGCDTSTHRVTRIEIGNKEITGTLPPDLKNLTSLSVFEVMGNKLTGKIPSLAGLRSLERVYVNDNGFTSIGADFFTGLCSLQYVNLGNNPLRPWEIPFSLTDATSLQVFSAVNCSLSGKIPERVDWRRRFPILTALELSDNSLVGELPRSFSGSPVQILKLDGQKLNGSISVLQNMTGLTEVFLQGNGFSGPLPDLSGLASLKVFIVSENQLTGSVPYSFARLSPLSYVALGGNFLQGPTPKLSTEKDETGPNSFCLDTPGAPCDPRVDALLSIAGSFGFPLRFAESWKGNDPCDSNLKWVGILCSGPNIVRINFSNMGLNGTISSGFAILKSLQVINLSHNTLSGLLPQQLAQLTDLTTLDVSYNHRLCGRVSSFRPNVVNRTGDPYLGTDDSLPVPGSSSRNNAGKIAGSVIGAVVGSLLIGFAIFFLIKKKNQHLKNKMHPQQHSDDKDALKISIGN